MRTDLVQRMLDLLNPRGCAICDRRLAPEEQGLCERCLRHLPRTDFLLHPDDNVLSRMYWGRVPQVAQAVALIYYHSQSEAVWPIYKLKYYNRPQLGEDLGRVMGSAMQRTGFARGIDFIIPIPLAAVRERQRGYNQSEHFALGLSEALGLPVATDVVVRTTFEGSQTHKGTWDRTANVEHVFKLIHGEKIRGCHVLLVDDVVTTGATTCACAKQLALAGDVTISVAAIAFVDKKR